ncbi:MAG TPA: TolC family protein [Terriglobales bacterium]|nr:TolC family protein [Terriglobales bacterium]
MTIEDSIGVALQVDPVVRSHETRKETAALELRRSRRWLPSNPYVNTSVSSSTFERTSGGDELAPETERAGPAFTFFLEQQFDLAGQRSIRIESAELAANIAELNRLHARNNLAARVKTAFTVALMRREISRLEQETFHWEGQAMEAWEQDPRRSLAVDVGRTNAETRLWRARRARQYVSRAYAKALAELRNLLRLPADTAIELEGTLPYDFEPPAEVESLIARGRSQRADLQAQSLLAQWSELQVKLARRNIVPTIALSGFVSHEDGEQQFGGGIGFPLPIFDHPGYEIRSATIDLDKTRAELAAAEQRVATEIRAAHADLLAESEDGRILRDEILPRLRRIAAGRDQLFDAGQGGSAEIINAELEVVEARRDLVDAAADYAVARIELERVVAAPLSAPIEQSGPAAADQQNSGTGD